MTPCDTACMHLYCMWLMGLQDVLDCPVAG